MGTEIIEWKSFTTNWMLVDFIVKDRLSPKSIALSITLKFPPVPVGDISLLVIGRPDWPPTKE